MSDLERIVAIQRVFETNDGKVLLDVLSDICFENEDAFVVADSDRRVNYVLGRLSVVKALRDMINKEFKVEAGK